MLELQGHSAVCAAGVTTDMNMLKSAQKAGEQGFKGAGSAVWSAGSSAGSAASGAYSQGSQTFSQGSGRFANTAYTGATYATSAGATATDVLNSLPIPIPKIDSECSPKRVGPRF